jgi:biopolymer transport protein ExbD
MRLERRRKEFGSFTEGDMTPMIDMTFQLIAFFMVLINFTQAEQHKRISLPRSEVAKPPEEQPEQSVTLHIDDENDAVIFVGREYRDFRSLEEALKARTREPNFNAAEATVILRGDKDSKTGVVQHVIAAAQNAGFQKFKLRAEQDRQRR